MTGSREPSAAHTHESCAALSLINSLLPPVPQRSRRTRACFHSAPTSRCIRPISAPRGAGSLTRATRFRSRRSSTLMWAIVEGMLQARLPKPGLRIQRLRLASNAQGFPIVVIAAESQPLEQARRSTDPSLAPVSEGSCHAGRRYSDLTCRDRAPRRSTQHADATRQIQHRDE